VERVEKRLKVFELGHGSVAEEKVLSQRMLLLKSKRRQVTQQLELYKASLRLYGEACHFEDCDF